MGKRRALAIGSALVIVAGAGAWLGRSGPTQPVEPELAKLLRPGSQQEKELTQAMSAILTAVQPVDSHPAAAPAVTPVAAGLSTDRRAAIDAALDRFAESGEDQALAERLGRGETGLRLRRLLQSPRHAGEFPEALLYQHQLLSELGASPDESYNAIVRAYDQLGPEGFDVERGTLLHLASLIPGKESEAQRLMSDEIARRPASSPPAGESPPEQSAE